MNPYNGYDLNELAVGQRATLSKTITEADIVLFSGVSTDANVLHLDADYARGTPFGGRIAHGMLVASLISAVLGNRLPGAGWIYLGQTLNFKAPVRPGDTVTATVVIREIVAAKGRIVLDARCTVADRVVVSGEAVMMHGAYVKHPPPPLNV
jgi:3-hydroxybutyryl-CoA dehydratase